MPISVVKVSNKRNAWIEQIQIQDNVNQREIYRLHLLFLCFTIFFKERFKRNKVKMIDPPYPGQCSSLRKNKQKNTLGL